MKCEESISVVQNKRLLKIRIESLMESDEHRVESENNSAKCPKPYEFQ